MFLALLFFIPIGLYWPGLYGDFFLDDTVHIVSNTSLQIDKLNFANLWAAAHTTESGPMGRPLALLSFALNYYFTGLDPYYFKLFNLLIHALTAIGIYGLIRRLLAHITTRHVQEIAFFTALLWAVHPLNVSTVLYAVQRMALLSTLFIVWGMAAYVHGRELLLRRNGRGYCWLLLGLIAGLAGLYAKETAVLMLGYLLVIEWLVFGFRMPIPWQSQVLKGGYILAIGAPLLWALSTHLFSSGWTENAFAGRSFTFHERLLTEGRVLWDYLYLTWLPDIQSMGLYHDGYRISHGLMQPPFTLVALTLHTILFVTALTLRRQWPLLLFAVSWFYVGHSAESTVLPLEIKFEHRNYLPMLGMLLVMTHGIYSVSDRLKNTKKLRVIVLSSVLLTFSGSAFVRICQFGDFWGFAGMEAEHHPESARANQHAAISLIALMSMTKKTPPDMMDKASHYLRNSANANPDTVGPLFTAVLFLPELTQQPPDPWFVTTLSQRLRYARTDANLNSFFYALLRQAEENKLQMDTAQIYEFFNNAEDNPHISHSVKADIMNVHAGYSLFVQHDIAKARGIVEQSLIIDPSCRSCHVMAIQIYQELRMWQEAEALLVRLRKVDPYGIEANNIKILSGRQKAYE